MVQDLSVFVNTLMFTCSIQPGLSDVLMDLVGFEGVALRLRKVVDFPGGGANLIGKSLSSMSHHWEEAVLAGILPPIPMEVDQPQPDNGMAPDGNRTIEQGDRLIFLSRQSLPTVSTGTPYKAADMSSRGEDVATANGQKPLNILVCGFRIEWKKARRFAFRIRDTSTSLADGSTIHFLNIWSPRFLMSSWNPLRGRIQKSCPIRGTSDLGHSKTK